MIFSIMVGFQKQVKRIRHRVDRKIVYKLLQIVILFVAGAVSDYGTHMRKQ